MPRIRAAGHDDVGAVLAVWSQARSGGADVTDTREDFERLIARSPDGVLVAESGADVVGTVIAVDDGWRGMISRLCVLPSHRRRGIGHALVDAAEELLRAKRVRRVNILVYEDDAGAADMWTARGYVTNPRITRYWHDL